MKQILYLGLFLAIGIAGNCQTLDSLMQSIEQHNPRIIAQQRWLEAEKTKAKTGIYPDNPELNYTYLWGNSELIGSQKELEITQSFRLPGYYTSKSGVQQLAYKQKVIFAQKTEMEVLHQARITYYTIVGLMKKESLLNKRMVESEKLRALMKEGFEQGEISRPAYDKARIYHLNIQNERKLISGEIQIQKEALQQMNGGVPLSNLAYAYPESLVLPSSESILTDLPENNPDILMARQNDAVNEHRVKLEKMNSLPVFEAGYKSEVFLDQKLRGIYAGIQIPLWENKNQVKKAQLQKVWAQASYQQIVSEINSEVKSLYNELETTYVNYMEMKEILESVQLAQSSYEVLQAGQISFPEYLVEVQFMYESQENYLETERRFFVLWSELALKQGLKHVTP